MLESIQPQQNQEVDLSWIDKLCAKAASELVVAANEINHVRLISDLQETSAMEKMHGSLPEQTRKVAEISTMMAEVE